MKRLASRSVLLLAAFLELAQGAAAQPLPRLPMTLPVSTTYLAAPTNLRTTNDLAECRNAAGGGFAGFACAAWMNTKAYVLMWNWSNAPCPQSKNCPSTVDGFQVYDAGTGKPLGNLALAHVQGFPQNAGSSNGCYFVRASLGTNQSASSQTLCVNSGMASTPKQIGNQYLTLQPAHIQTSYEQWGNGTGILGTTFMKNQQTYPGTVDVGFKYHAWENNSGDVGWNEFKRGAAYFDLSPILGSMLRHAFLNLHVASSVIGSRYQPNSSASCIGKIGFAEKDWWDYADWIEGSWFTDISRSAGPNVSVEVTNQVRQWLGGSVASVIAGPQPNYGFVFRGEDENLHAYTDDSCLTHYDIISLNVTYYWPSK